MCGIFACFIHGSDTLSEREVAGVLLNGLGRLEYRGYDSAGLCLSRSSTCVCSSEQPAVQDQFCPRLLKTVGTVSVLRELVDREMSPGSVNGANGRRAKCTDDSRRGSCAVGQRCGTTHVGIAHTRWATHGAVSVENCHPHVSSAELEFVVVHNGIITNYQALKEMLLKKGTRFESDTDTEVVVKLIHYLYSTLLEAPSESSRKTASASIPFEKLVMHLMRHLEGAFALIFLSTKYPGQIVACKRGSPLVIGLKGEYNVSERTKGGHFSKTDSAARITSSKLSKGATASLSLGRTRNLDSEGRGHDELNDSTQYFFASDVNAIVEHTDRVLYTEDNDIVSVRSGELQVFNVTSEFSYENEDEQMVVPNRQVSTIQMELHEIMKGSFPHFMKKEIFEQPESIKQTMRGRILNGSEVHLTGVREHMSDIRKSTRLIFVASGTSYNACMASRQILEELSEIPVIVELAGDFMDRLCPIFRSDVVAFVSQSGETADTLDALKYARKHGAMCMGIVNVVGSSISRLTDFGVHLNAGSEIGVASTKVYTSQIVVMVMIALELSADSKNKSARRIAILQGLRELSANIEKTILLVDEHVQRIADQLADDRSILCFGRGYHYATCVEAALKIKEVAYIHTEGINAGELKHGPIALVDENLPIVVFSSMDLTAVKVQSAIHQLLARGVRQRLIVVCSESDTQMLELVASREGVDVIKVAHTVDCLQSVLSIIPMQLLSYYLAVARKLNVDCPRNLAKSVTVH
ncbi:Glutamine--fructose-6-phosphate aminotransferase isomerizing 2 [Porphyridium purpureum]|uniref:glutamine--fructose-6-phosphate transaminase (isomerizing) n=1 Tax=Porphyridium purpureum TaxID=35688 RepID=A0A5J4YZ01_PORPP|nr:Glutamine--fructose-6-phosphate aminotransferase isomerizing 2 [Porphyridium purpureum]|eukprot:POR5123..scf209_3